MPARRLRPRPGHIDSGGRATDLAGMTIQPTLFVPHGGGPCFFMDDPAGTWTKMGDFLRDLPGLLPAPPSAILCISGHWETQGFRFTGKTRPGLLFDYFGFPPHTYELSWPVPGDPALAARAAALLADAGLDAGIDADRDLDHGVFVPLKLSFPDADVPVVEMSLDAGLDPALAYAAGRALRPLRDEGVLIVGAGMSFHNMRAHSSGVDVTPPSRAFDDWLGAAVAEQDGRGERLARWADAPAARWCHPREEHLLPLMVAAGAAEGPGERVYEELLLGLAVSGYRFA